MAPIQEVKFVHNRLGGVALVIDNCKYRINRRSGTTVYWRCFFRWCRANAVVEDGQLKSSGGKHICPQPLHRQLTVGVASKGRQQQSTYKRTGISVAPVLSPSSAVKMATRAAQGTSGGSGIGMARSSTTSNGGGAAIKTAVNKVLRSQQQPANSGNNKRQKPATNNNMVQQQQPKRKSSITNGKSNGTEEALDGAMPGSPAGSISELSSIKTEHDEGDSHTSSPPKQVNLIVL